MLVLGMCVYRMSFAVVARAFAGAVVSTCIYIYMLTAHTFLTDASCIHELVNV